jgi:hypothetical protein
LSASEWHESGDEGGTLELKSAIRTSNNQRLAAIDPWISERRQIMAKWPS